MSVIINTRSPFYVKISVASMASAELKIYIYEGALATSPNANNLKYTLSKASLGTDSYVVFEVAELVRDYLESKYDGEYDSYSVWVMMDINVLNATNDTVFNWTSTPSNLQNSVQATGTADGTDTNKLIDSSASFTSTVAVGDIAVETQSGNFANVTAVDSDTQLTLDDHIIQSGGGYTIYRKTYYSLLATEGYGYFEEGINPDIDKGLMMSPATIYRIDDRSINIPVYAATTNIVSFLNNNTVIKTHAVSDNGNTNQKIQYIASDGNSTADSYKERVLEDGGVFEDNSLLEAFSESFDIGAVDEVYVNYYKEVTSGTATSTTSNKLVDSSAQFSNTASSSYFIRNLTDNTIAQITTVDSDTTLSLSSDIMTSGENYEMSRTITHVLKVKTFPCSKYEPIRVTFVNKYGALQDIYFNRRSNDSISVTTEDYKASIVDLSTLSYDKTSHQQRTLNLVGKESITLNTDYIDESCNEHIRELMLSEQLWMTKLTDEETIIPLRLRSQSTQLKKSVNEKLIQYTMQFDFAFDKINNIR
jgi:hypothetical protein